MSITVNGKALYADQIGARLLAPVSLMAIGTGTPGASALGAEISRHGCQNTSSGGVATYKAHWDIDDQLAASITEVGLFNTGGTLVASQSFTAVAKGLNDPFNVVWNVNL